MFIFLLKHREWNRLGSEVRLLLSLQRCRWSGAFQPCSRSHHRYDQRRSNPQLHPSAPTSRQQPRHQNGWVYFLSLSLSLMTTIFDFTALSFFFSRNNLTFSLIFLFARTYYVSRKWLECSLRLCSSRFTGL